MAGLPRSAAGISTMLAPRLRIGQRHSTLKFSVITAASGWPFTAQTMARPMPLLPLVVSIAA